MKSLLAITQSFGSLVTGGQQINSLIYAFLEKRNYRLTCSRDVLNQNNNLFFLVSLVLKIKILSKYDKILIDSSLFPKVFLFVFLFRIFFDQKKIVVLHHHFVSATIIGWKKSVYGYLEKILLKNCGFVIVFSPFTFSETSKIILKEKIHYVGLPFEKKELCEHNPIDGRLLYVGTIEDRKGLIYLVKALSLLPKEMKERILLNIVGKTISNDYLTTLKKEVEKASLQNAVSFCGRLERDELDHLYNTSSLFVFPSLYEGFGMVIIEAMQRSLPVIAFDNTAMPYTIKNNENGIIVPNKDCRAFANAIKSLLENRSLYEKLSDGARNTGIKAQTYEEFENNIVNLIDIGVL